MRSPPDTPAPSKAMAPPSARQTSRAPAPAGESLDEVEVEDVVALAAEQELRSRAADEAVVAVAADEDVVAGVAAEGVVAGVAVELVLAAGALDRVGELVAVAVDGVAADDRQVLHAEAEVVRHVGEDEVHAADRVLGALDDGVAEAVDVVDVVAVVAVHLVGADVAVEPVVAVAAEQRVVAGEAGQVVVAVVAVEHVVGGVAEDVVVARAALGVLDQRAGVAVVLERVEDVGRGRCRCSDRRRGRRAAPRRRPSGSRG